METKMNIDFKLLKKQKENLIELISTRLNQIKDAKYIESIDGIINLLDAIQDAKELTVDQLAPKVTVLMTGQVLGNYWGGGMGAYAARQLKEETVEAALNKAKEMLKDGSLDSGMGYESLIGAKLQFHIITRIEIEGREFENIECQYEYIGELTDDQKDFMDDIMPE